MGMITVRDIDDSVLRALNERASAAGRSLEDEVRETLAQSVNPQQQPSASRKHREFWEQADRLRASFGDRVVSDSGEIASEMREERSRQIGEP